MGRSIETQNASLFGLLIGGSMQVRAAMCHAAQGQKLHLEPVAEVGELGAIDLNRAQFIIAWNDAGLIKDMGRHMRKAGSWLPIIACADELSLSEVVDAIEAGAIDVLEWPTCVPTLAETVQAILAKRKPQLSQLERARRARDRLHRLTVRERQVMTFVAEGYSNKDIAAELEISPRTVEIHRMNSLQRLGVKGTASAVGLVFEASFADDEDDQSAFFWPKQNTG